MKQNDAFREKIHRAQSYPVTLAKRTIVARMKEGDGNLALRFLERRQPERYRTKIEMPVLSTQPITVILPGSKPHPRFVSK